MYRNLILCGLALVAPVAGCTSAAAVGEQRAFRLQTANLYEHQVWDNLCRVYSQRLLVQLRFDSVTGTLADTLGSVFTWAHADPGTISTDTFTSVANASRVNTIAITAVPVVDGGTQAKIYEEGDFAEKEKHKYIPVRSIYEDYIGFVYDLEKIKPDRVGADDDGRNLTFYAGSPKRRQFVTPRITSKANRQEYMSGRFVCQEGKPDREKLKIHIKHPNPYEKNGWCYVPQEASSEFFNLSMVVSFGYASDLNAESRPESALVRETRLQRLLGN